MNFMLGWVIHLLKEQPRQTWGNKAFGFGHKPEPLPGKGSFPFQLMAQQQRFHRPGVEPHF